jgi:hypothetical protein
MKKVFLALAVSLLTTVPAFAQDTSTTYPSSDTAVAASGQSQDVQHGNQQQAAMPAQPRLGSNDVRPWSLQFDNSKFGLGRNDTGG